MANDVEIEVEFRRPALPTEQVKSDSRKLGDQAGTEFNSGITKAIERESAKFKQSFDRLITKSLQDGSSALDTARMKADGLRNSLARMRADLAQTGNTDFLPGIRSAERDLKTLEDAIKTMAPKIKKDLTEAGRQGGAAGGKSAGDEFVKGVPFGIGKAAFSIGSAVTKLFEQFTAKAATEAVKTGEAAGSSLAQGVASTAAQDVPELFTPAGAIGAGILAAIVVSLAPAVAGALSLALVAGAGGGLLAVGALIEHDNANIVAKAGQLGSDLTDTMKQSAVGLEEPFERALTKIDKWVKDEGPAFKGLFDSVAGSVGPLTDDVLHFVSAVTPGLTRLGTTFTQLFSDPGTSAVIDSLGSNINAFFETVARHKQLVSDTFLALVTLLNMALGLMNLLIVSANGVDRVFRAMISPLIAIHDHFNRIDASSKWVSGTANDTAMLLPIVESAALTYDDLAASMSKTAVTANTLAGSLTDKVLNGLLNNDFAVLHFDESLTKLGESFDQNGKHLDILTAKGQANREAVLAVVKANLEQYDTMIASGDSAETAAAQYDTNTAALEAQLHKAGLTKGQIDDLIGTYRKVPGKVNTLVAMEGLTKAITDLNETLRLINGLHDKTVTINVRRVGGAGPSTPSTGDPLWHPPSTPSKPTPSGGLGHKAAGGIGGGYQVVGENGWELAHLPQGTTTYSHAQSVSMMSGADTGGGGSFGPATLEFVGNTDSAMATAIARLFRDGKIQLKVGDKRVSVGSP